YSSHSDFSDGRSKRALLLCRRKRRFAAVHGHSQTKRYLRRCARRLPDLRQQMFSPAGHNPYLPQLRRAHQCGGSGSARRMQSQEYQRERGTARQSIMFIRLLKESIARNPRRKLLAGAALVLGMAVATATLTVAVDVGDQLAREFQSFGANLLVTPQQDTLPVEIGGVDYRPVTEGAYLPVAELPKLKSIFWRHNILGFAPFLDAPVKAAMAGQDKTQKKFSATLVGTWHKHSLPVDDSAVTFTTGAVATHPWWKVQGRWFDEQSHECLIGTELAQRNS